ncbi:MAG TPA: phosphopantetheine-binding protein [Myxococcaceae bacterium]|nr:phosphopantetheine-binding protein [Myxococcaceae bacterium]
MRDAELMEKVVRAVRDSAPRPVDPEPAHRLVDDLGFDSLRMASLAIALETEMGQPVLLNDWIASAPSLSDLTVQSLATHMAANLEPGS